MDRRVARVTLIAAVAVVAALATGGAVGTVAADHGDSVDRDEIIEVQTVTSAGTDPGTVEVTVGYHVGNDVGKLDIQLTDEAIEEVVATDGFGSTGDPDTYRWERGQAASDPSIRVRVDANRSSERFSGLDAVDTAAWTLTPRLAIGVRWWARHPEDIEFGTATRTGERGVSGQRLVYLGEHDVHEFDGDGERFRLVVGEYAREPSIEEVRRGLVAASRALSVGGRSGTVTVFVAGDPLREGGKAFGSDLWAHRRSLPPADDRRTLIHEYVHTRQDHEPDESTEWTTEAEAEYYEHLLALRQGDIEYERFHERFSHFEGEYDDVVLADPDTWTGTRADYERGGLTVAALDAAIRAASDGDGSYQDVLRAKNAHDGEVSLADLEGFATDAAGRDTGEFFDRYVRSRPESLDVPPPASLAGPPTDATLAVGVEGTTVHPGERATVSVSVENTGTEPSIVPYLAVEWPDGIDRTGQRPYVYDQGLDAVTTVDDTTPLPHLDPGESLEVQYEIRADESVPPGQRTVAVDAADIGDTWANASDTIEVVPVPPEVSVVADASVEQGETVTAIADVENVEHDHEISWTVDGENVSQRGERAEFAFEEPGTHVVAATVEGSFGTTRTAEHEVRVRERDADGSGSRSAGGEGSSGSRDATTGATPGSEGHGFGVVVGLLAPVVLVTLARIRR